MKFKLLSGIIALILIIGCSKSNELTVEEQKLVDILVDIHLIEATLQRTSNFVRDSMAEIYYNQLAEIHQMERPVYEQKILELNQDPDRLEKVYIQVIEKLNKAEITQNSEENKPVD